MAADDRVVLFGEDIAGGAGRDEDYPEAADAWGGPFGVTQGLLGKFGRRRVVDTAIAETCFVGASVGAAIAGLRPVAEIMYVDFIGTSFDQLLNQAGWQLVVREPYLVNQIWVSPLLSDSVKPLEFPGATFAISDHLPLGAAIEIQNDESGN